MTAIDARPNRRRLFAGIVTQLVIRAAGVAAGVLVAAGLARGLTHVEFGQFSLALSLVGIAATVGDLGLLTTSVRQLAAHPERRARTVGAIVIARLVTGTLGAAFVAASVYVLGTSSIGGIATILVGASLLFAPLEAMQAVGQADLRLGAQNVLLVLQNTLWTATVLTLVAAHASLLWFAAGFLFTSAVQAFASAWAYRGRIKLTFDGALAELRRILRLAAPIALGGLFVTSYYRFGGVILYDVAGPDAVADYSAAFRFLDILQVVPATLLVVILPLLSATWRDESAEMVRRRSRLFGLALSAVIAAALPLAVGGALLARPMIELIYGASFSAAAPLLSALLLSFPAICIGYVVVGLALAGGKTLLYCGVSLGAALLSVPSNLILVPQFGGIAAAWITVGTEYLVSTSLLVLLTRRASVRIPVRAWSGTAAATLCMAVVVVLLRPLPLFVPLVAGGLVFVGAAFVFRALTPADIRAMLDRKEVWI